MVSSVDHLYGGSAVMAAPHPLELRRTHHHAKSSSSIVNIDDDTTHTNRIIPTIAEGGTNGEGLLVSPRISSAARKRKEVLSKKQHASSEKLTSSSKVAAAQLSSARSSRQQNNSAPRSSRGIHSVDSFDPADMSDASSLTNSVPASSISVSYAEALINGMALEEDGVEVEEVEEHDEDGAYMYCEDEVESLCRQGHDDEEEIASNHHHLSAERQRQFESEEVPNEEGADGRHDFSFDEERGCTLDTHHPNAAQSYEDIPEELAGPFQSPSEVNHYLFNFLQDDGRVRDDDEETKQQQQNRANQLLETLRLASVDDVEIAPRSGDDDDNSDIYLSSVCSSPDFDRDPNPNTGEYFTGPPPREPGYDPMEEIRRELDYVKTSFEPMQHPFLAMDRQQAMMSHERSDMHQEFCSKHYQQQQVSMWDRTTMIRALLFEAHRHQSTRRKAATTAVSASARTVELSEQKEFMVSSESDRRPSILHQRGWQAVATDVERTMVMEGVMSAQRKLSCMCIFNPKRIDPPVMESVDDERFRRMERQEGILRHIYSRPDNILFADDIREGVSTPHPFAATAPIDYETSDVRQRDDAGFQPGYPCGEGDEDDEVSNDDTSSSDSDSEGRPSWQTYEAPISIPLPSYASTTDRSQREAM
jgi:hypothetical protein